MPKPIIFKTFQDALDWARKHAKDHLYSHAQRWRVEKLRHDRYAIAIKWLSGAHHSYVRI